MFRVLLSALLLFSSVLPVLAAGRVCAATADATADPATAADLFRQGQYTAAHGLFLQQAEAQRQAGQGWTRDQARTLFNLGAAAAATGDLAGAVLSFRESVAVFERQAVPGGPDDLDLALSLEGLASVLIQQENLEEAQNCLDRALKLRKTHYPENHPQLARLYAMMASAAQLRGDFEGTEELYYKALMAYRRIHGNVHPTVAEIIQNIGTFYTERGDFQAEIMFLQAKYVGEMLYGPWHPLRAVSLANLGSLRWRQERYAEAEQELRQALEIHDHLGFDSAPEPARCLTLLGRVLLAQDRHAEAVPVLERAAQVYEGAWWRAGSGAERSLVVKSPYPYLAIAYLNLDRPEQALQAFESYQGRLAALTGRLRHLPLEMATRRDALVRELGEREEALALSSDDLARQGEARAALADAQSRWLEFQNQASASMQHRGDLKVEDIQRSLRPGRAQAGWIEAELRPGQSQVWGFVMRGDTGLHWVRTPDLPEPWETPSALAAAALGDLAGTGDPAPGALAQLRSLAVSPLERHLHGVQGLTVMASGFMAGFPVEMLLTGGQEVVYAPHLAAYAGPSGKGAPLDRQPRVLVVADPPFSSRQELARTETQPALPEAVVLRSALGGNRQAVESLPPLAGTRQEAEALERVFPGTRVLLGSEASEPALRDLADRDELKKFDIIHLATHALIDAERPGLSALVLSQLGRKDDRGRDGLLTADEIHHNWRLDAELVTLSACATALGRRIDGEGYLGFTHTLMGAGARNILVSLWPLDDRATSMLMERFYTSISQGATPGSALQEARHWLRDYTTPTGTRPFSAPRYWAGFVLFRNLD
jgi:tetratricopeptide (TPR) repeat protein